MAGLTFSGVRKTYPNGVRAVHGIDASVGDGELIVIVGPSGCGKSTLLRMVAGLEAISEGEIRIGERRVNELEPADRNIAMVFQNYALYPHMSVFDNMAYGLRNRRTPRNEIARRVAAAAKTLQLEDLLARRPGQLSGGQRQRVAMGRAIVREPDVFLFDEPLSNLDARLRVQMRLEIRRLQQSLGTTSLYVTHDQVEAMTLADRLIVMNGGVAEQIGRPLDVYRHPATAFVAGFIGSPAMNFLPATVAATGSGVIISGTGHTLTAAVTACEPQRPVLVGLRPEHLLPASEDSAALKVAVDLVEALGADTLAHGILPGDGAGPALTVRLEGSRRVDVGDTVPLTVSPDHVHLFDPGNGNRLV